MLTWMSNGNEAMTPVERRSVPAPTGPSAEGGDGPLIKLPLHRVGLVRCQQGVSLRSAARRLGVDIRELRRQERETFDLLLSELYQWQKVLDVPIVDLVVDPGTQLSRPVLERARLVKLMKTVMALWQLSSSPAMRRPVQTMVDQLVEIMPELKEVSAWPSVGQRRRLDEYGRAAERCISEEFFFRSLPD